MVNCFRPKESSASLIAVVSMTKRDTPKPQSARTKCKDKAPGQVTRFGVWL